MNCGSQTFFHWNSQFKNRNALIIYTSGSTGPPKGVVLTHGNLHAQISAVVPSWEISAEDSVLNALPLHHIHGLMNGLLCLLHVGGTVVMQAKFDPSETWKYFLNSEEKRTRVNLFFAVPTMYVKLIREFENMSENVSSSRKKCLENMRLMSSGSAALPEPVFYRWEDITGHRLLERFGMSEIGMALSNPLNGPRVPGTVGKPLPRVEAGVRKITDSSGDYSIYLQASSEGVKVSEDYKGQSGELLIRGPNVFKEYWNNKEATLKSFTNDGWFLTGDTVTLTSGYFKILGRTSVDIIKSGGYKISALEVESCLLSHPDILECTVFGLPDEEWGERVSALIVIRDGIEIPTVDLKTWCKKHLASYAVPSVIKHVDTIPRNVMGKVNKKELRTTVTK